MFQSLEGISQRKPPTAAKKADRLEELHYCQPCLRAHDMVAMIHFRREMGVIRPAIGAHPFGAHPSLARSGMLVLVQFGRDGPAFKTTIAQPCTGLHGRTLDQAIALRVVVRRYIERTQGRYDNNLRTR